MYKVLDPPRGYSFNPSGRGWLDLSSTLVLSRSSRDGLWPMGMRVLNVGHIKQWWPVGKCGGGQLGSRVHVCHAISMAYPHTWAPFGIPLAKCGLKAT